MNQILSPWVEERCTVRVDLWPDLCRDLRSQEPRRRSRKSHVVGFPDLWL